ncbi:hypothetical protein H920_14311 [Fukomys damarensis]|uniref:Uncharacterized protein n=1 Tax=Fukomys damarensis TaxID=885580 RepID=A0A091DND7_FUKDA|nr:hypothetical protein H920_14311 [Fukomys damarensis]
MQMGMETAAMKKEEENEIPHGVGEWSPALQSSNPVRAEGRRKVTYSEREEEEEKLLRRGAMCQSNQKK